MSLRAQVFRGGAYLALRQLLSLGISLVGVVLLTRLIGPTDYGLYVGSFAIVVFLMLVGRFGVDAYVIRRDEPIGPEVYGLAFALMAVSGLVIATATVVLAPLVLDRLVDPEFVRPLQGLVLVVPLSLVLAPALATLDRRLDYRSVAMLELGERGHLLRRRRRRWRCSTSASGRPSPVTGSARCSCSQGACGCARPRGRRAAQPRRARRHAALRLRLRDVVLGARPADARQPARGRGRARAGGRRLRESGAARGGAGWVSPARRGTGSRSRR